MKPFQKPREVAEILPEMYVDSINVSQQSAKDNRNIGLNLLDAAIQRQKNAYQFNRLEAFLFQAEQSK